MSDQRTGRMPRAVFMALRVLGAVGGGYALTACVLACARWLFSD